MGAGSLELWGGIECTVNRIGDRYFDHVIQSGHHERLRDLDRIATLGIAKLRYPVLWERVAPNGVKNADWTWIDQRLCRLHELGIEPIVTLMHHGSGPRDTDLLDPNFPRQLAAFALAVAKRYPWLRYFTPISEPLTTARLSALYGIWYPHAQSEKTFLTAFLHQLEGIACSMRAIRGVIPDAQLVQTEDLAKTHGKPALQQQIEFENARRWLTFDLQTNSFENNLLMQKHFKANGFVFKNGDLKKYRCPPNVLGLNYHITSERFLDDCIEHYDGLEKDSTIVGDRYADVPATNVCIEGSEGLGVLAMECWERYRSPMAITEIRLACTREEQLRWIGEIHREAVSVRERGADMRAITLWTLFGARDRNSLLTGKDGVYETGAFDIRSTPPRPTAIARYARALANNEEFNEPVLEGQGWWHRCARFTHPPALRTSTFSMPSNAGTPHTVPRPLLVAGASEPLGIAVAQMCKRRAIPIVKLTTTCAARLTEYEIGELMRGEHAWGAVDCSGTEYLSHLWTTPDACVRSNPETARKIAIACERNRIRLVRFSGEDVFSGLAMRDYLEADDPDAPDVAGRVQAEIESITRETLPRTLLVRTGVLFGAQDASDALATMLRCAVAGQRIPVARSIRFSAAYVDDVVSLALDLLIDDESGIWHIVNSGSRDWPELVCEALERLGLADRSSPDISRAVPRSVVLASLRGSYLCAIDEALDRCISERDLLKTLR